MNEETQKHLLAQIQENFATFGAGQQFKGANKTALALEDEPLCFAAGVDVADVVELVLREAQKHGRGTRTPIGHQGLRDACKKIEGIAGMGEFVDESGLRRDMLLILRILMKAAPALTEESVNT